MRRLKILQVGDVHYPEHTKPDADIKDKLLGAELVGSATSVELKAATRALLGAVDENPGALLAFMGDLTSKGSVDDYGRCVQFLRDVFLLNDAQRWSKDQLHVVPGNHDVNRDLAKNAPAGDLFHKFGPLDDAWHAANLDILATTSVRMTEVTSGPCAIRAYGMNSCLGAGERRELPPAVHGALVSAMKEAGVADAESAAVADKLMADHAEVIDAPAYAEEHINAVYEAIRGSEAKTVAVLIAHHNILQQAQPRFDVYTDVINAGMFRARLTSLALPIIYLHGHIHDDPIEDVRQLAPDAGQLICISAPEFRTGFNIVEVHFSDEGTPIGCVVERTRVRPHGGTSTEPSVRIPFVRYEMAISGVATHLAAHLLSNPSCSSLIGAQLGLREGGRPATEAEVADALEEVEWLGLVEVINRERPHRNWRIRVVALHD